MGRQPEGRGGGPAEAMQTGLSDEHLVLATLPGMFPINLALTATAGILSSPFLLYDPWDRKDPKVMLINRFYNIVIAPTSILQRFFFFVDFALLICLLSNILKISSTVTH